MSRRFIYLMLMLLCNVNAFADKAGDLTFKPQAQLVPVSWSVFFIVAIAVIGLIAYWFKLKNPVANNQQSLSVIAKKQLSAKTTAYVIDIDKQSFLIVDNGQHVATECVSSSHQNKNAMVTAVKKIENEV